MTMIPNPEYQKPVSESAKVVIWMAVLFGGPVFLALCFHVFSPTSSSLSSSESSSSVASSTTSVTTSAASTTFTADKERAESTMINAAQKELNALDKAESTWKPFLQLP